jgi:hypothetical protein
LIWDDDDLPANNYRRLSLRLAEAGDLYRTPVYGGGLLLANPQAGVGPFVIAKGSQLASIAVDRVRVRREKKGQTRGYSLPAAELKIMLRSEAFLQAFRPVDQVVRVAHYLPDFTLLVPGYNDGGPGMRYLYAGPDAWVERQPEAINRFLDVMAFATAADRANAVAAALTVLLRNHWPGAKPLVAVTSTKSHGGKDTIIHFAAGTTPKTSISYESTDWAFQKAFVAAVKHRPHLGVVNVENARLDARGRYIASGFLERLLTDAEPLFYSPGSGEPFVVPNQLVVALSSNSGNLSEDLLNRALPIHLDPVGNVADRVSPIGNPKLEYLPANREQIEAELRGLVETWKDAGRPLDEDVRHPFAAWARTVGGILRANGFTDFLTNYALRKTADDPVRHALGLLGVARPEEWLRAGDWARLAVRVGVVKDLVSPSERDTDQGRERALGVVLSAHRDETFVVETEDNRLTLRLEKARGRFDGKEAKTRYRFTVLATDVLPEDHVL